MLRSLRRLTVLSVFGLLALCRPASLSAAPPALPPVLLQMIRDPAVHEELGLAAEQAEQLRGALEEVDGPWWRSRIQPPEVQQPILAQLTSQLRGRLEGFLSGEQIKRLRELERQALGTRMFLRGDVATSLALSPEVRETLHETFSETDRKAAKLQKEQQAGERTAESAQQALTDLKTEERRRVIGLLSANQRAQIAELTGQRFDFSRVSRTLPLAPELTSEGATWLQGGPLQLEDLRGQVVAVHFYAFQCINCRRNLPHYQAWHKDYADQGLVIIGIQTPETSAERKPERVRQAMEQEGIEYPVLMDSESANWQRWGNTMWPTVYLVDKQGYLRRWWQGELNWQGTPGERQMRETIEQLLAESDSESGRQSAGLSRRHSGNP